MNEMLNSDFFLALIGFCAGSAVGTVAFYMLIPEFNEMRKEFTIGGLLTFVVWGAVLIGGTVWAFTKSTLLGGFVICGLGSGLMTTIRMNQ